MAENPTSDPCGAARGTVEPIRLSDVVHVARLARVHLESTEVEHLAKDMADILGHFSAIERGDRQREGDDQPVDRGLAPVLRADEPDPDPLLRAVENLAPDWRGGFIVVPRLQALGRQEEA